MLIGMILILAVGFLLQYGLGFIQIKNFNKHYTELRRRGRVAIGRRPSIFKAGTLVLLQIDQNNKIEKGRYMQGVTVFARFKKLSGLEGKAIGTLNSSELSAFNPLLGKAVLDAKNTFMTIESGGEIKDIPSPFLKVANRVKQLLKRKG